MGEWSDLWAVSGGRSKDGAGQVGAGMQMICLSKIYNPVFTKFLGVAKHIMWVGVKSDQLSNFSCQFFP